jgi:hypothetical protein
MNGGTGTILGSGVLGENQFLRRIADIELLLTKIP